MPNLTRPVQDLSLDKCSYLPERITRFCIFFNVFYRGMAVEVVVRSLD